MGLQHGISNGEMEGRKPISEPRPANLLAVQVLDLGRNDFGPELFDIIFHDLAVVQVAVDLDEPAFRAFHDYFLGQFPESNDGVPLDIFLVAKLGVGGHAKGGGAVIGSEEGRVCAQVAGQDHQIVAVALWLLIVLHALAGCVVG